MKQNIYIISFLIYIAFSVFLLLGCLVTSVRIRIISRTMNNNERCSYLDFKLQKFTKMFTYRQRAINVYTFYSAFFSLLTSMIFCKTFWWAFITYTILYISRISLKLLNIVNAGFYYKGIGASIAELFIWLPYFVIMYLHGRNALEVEGFEYYLDESLELPYD